MLNQVVLVGRLTRKIVVNTSESGVKVATISLAIPRSFKNSEGVYETDFVDCIAFGAVALNTRDYCDKGDIIGVKGRIQSKLVERNGRSENEIDVICEKVTFLSSHSRDEKKKEEKEEKKETK